PVRAQHRLQARPGRQPAAVPRRRPPELTPPSAVSRYRAGPRPGRDAGDPRVRGAEMMGGAMRIDEKVRDAHLEHFCPGGLGLAVTTSRPAWPGRPADAPAGLDGNAARGAGPRSRA